MKKYFMICLALSFLVGCQKDFRSTENEGMDIGLGTTASLEDRTSTSELTKQVAATSANQTDEEILAEAIKEAESILAELKGELEKVKENEGEKEIRSVLEQIIKDQEKLIGSLKNDEGFQADFVKMVREVAQKGDLSDEDIQKMLCEDIAKIAENAGDEEREFLKRDLEKCEAGESLLPTDEGFGDLGDIGGLGNFPKEICEFIKKDIESGDLPADLKEMLEDDYKKNCTE